MVADGVVGQRRHRPHLVHQILRHIALLAGLLDHPGQLARQLLHAPPGVVHLPGIPGLLHLLRCPVFRQLDGRAHAVPLLFCKFFGKVCLVFRLDARQVGPAFGFRRFFPGTGRRILGRFQLLGKFCLVDKGLCPCFQCLLLRLLPHLLPLVGKLLAVPGVLFGRHFRAVQVAQHQLHGNVLSASVPILVVGVLHHGPDGIVGSRHGVQRIRCAGRHFAWQQPRAQLLQFGKIGVPAAVLALLGLGNVHAVPRQLLPGIGPAAPSVHDLPVVLRALLDFHAHLVQFRVCPPQLIVSLAALAHHLFGHVRGKAVHVLPAHLFAEGNVVAHGPDALGQRLCVHLAARVAQHRLCNAVHTLVAQPHLAARFHRLPNGLGLLLCVTQGRSLHGLHVLGVYVQLVFHGCFFRVELLGLGLRHGLQVVQRSSRQRLGGHGLDISVGIV